jgi:uncharacterized protein (DUF488 family)
MRIPLEADALSVKLFTIGFTKKSAESFFTALKRSHVRRLVDVRLNNVSQLAGFTKKNDLRYFTREICGIEYLHLPQLAPIQEMLDEYKKRKGAWSDYERKFLDLMVERRVEQTDKALLDGACLLCSEERPAYCHRRLVAEYLRDKWTDLEIVHL